MTKADKKAYNAAKVAARKQEVAKVAKINFEAARADKYSAAPATTPEQQREMNSVTPTRHYYGRPYEAKGVAKTSPQRTANVVHKVTYFYYRQPNKASEAYIQNAIAKWMK